MSWSRLGASKQTGGLGFRDLEAFNLALLAKQGWRLLQYPNSLLANVLKGKYFPWASFMHAKMGSRPSFMWCSLLKAGPLLDQGLTISGSHPLVITEFILLCKFCPKMLQLIPFRILFQGGGTTI
jgi:hypothetical protein